MDTLTPVSIYLKIRDKYSNSLLLESSDYGVNDNSYAYICFNPIAEIYVENNFIIKSFPDGNKEKIEINENINVVNEIDKFFKLFMGKSSLYSFLKAYI